MVNGSLRTVDLTPEIKPLRFQINSLKVIVFEFKELEIFLAPRFL